MFPTFFDCHRWLKNWRGYAVRVCGLKGDVTHLKPPASHLLHSKQLQQLFGISRPAITACEYYCTTRIMRSSCWSARGVQNLVGNSDISDSSAVKCAGFAGLIWNILKRANNRVKESLKRTTWSRLTHDSVRMLSTEADSSHSSQNWHLKC